MMVICLIIADLELEGNDANGSSGSLTVKKNIQLKLKTAGTTRGRPKGKKTTRGRKPVSRKNEETEQADPVEPQTYPGEF